MSNITLEELVAETKESRIAANRYVSLFEQVDSCNAFTKRNALPFSRPMVRLESELVELTAALAVIGKQPDGEAYERLYTLVTPLFRQTKQIPIRERWQKFLEAPFHEFLWEEDSVSLFLDQANGLLLDYSDGDVLFADTLVKDKNLFYVVTEVIKGSQLFGRESVNRASESTVGMMEDVLRNLQQLCQFDVEGAMKSYLKLLGDVKEFCEQNDVTPLYEGVKPRHLPSLTAAAQSHFVISKADDVRFVQRRQTIVSAADERLKVVKLLASSQDWSGNIAEIATFLQWEEKEDVDKYRVVDLVDVENGKAVLQGAPYSKVSISDIIGQESNVRQLGQMLYAFGAGREIPRILLIGGPGTGKTLSLRALADVHDDLRIVLVRSGHISGMETLLDLLRAVPYRVVAYVDDMHFGVNFDFEGYKTTTSGMKNTWPKNVAFVASINPESYRDKDIPSSVKSRFGLVLNYGLGIKPEHQEAVFRSVCQRQDVLYMQELFQSFKESAVVGKGNKDTVNGRQMEDFIKAYMAVKGVSFPAALIEKS